MKSKILLPAFAALTLAFSVSSFASESREDYTPFVNSISVTGGNPLMRVFGSITMGVLSGDCKLAVGADAEVKDVPTNAKGVSMYGVVVTVRPVVTECSGTRVSKMLTASASLDQLAKEAVEKLPAEQTKGLPVIIQLPQLR